MTPPEIEKIGLAKQADEALSAEPTGSDASRPASAPATPRASTDPAAQRPGRTRGLHPVLIVLLLLVVAGMAFGLFNQVQRAQQLEGQVAFLSDELDRAHDDLAAYEQQMEGVRSAVADISRRMSSLQTLVNQPPGADEDR